MKVLVTGGCGMLARAMAIACEGVHDIVPFDRSDDAQLLGGVTGDIADAQAVMDAASGCDAIVHTAAMHGGDRKTATTAQYIATNVVGADHVFQAAVRHGIRRVVTASSMEVLVGRDWTASGLCVLDEQSTPHPDWIYPTTKLQVEILGDFYARSQNLSVAHLRYMAFATQPWRDIGYSLLARYISAEDAATATLAAAQTPGFQSEVFLIGPDTPLGQSDINMAMDGRVWEAIENHWPASRDVLAEHLGMPDPSDFWPIARTNKAHLILGWKPVHTFDRLLREFGWAPADLVAGRTHQ